MRKSVWQNDASLSEFPTLSRELSTDVLVIGGGLAGLLTAWELRQRGVDVALVEMGRLCSATTVHTTAKLTAQHGLIYQKLIRSLGVEGASQYYKANAEAVEQLKNLCHRFGAPIDEKANFVYSSDRRKLDRELDAFQKLGIPAIFVEAPPLPLSAAGAIGIPGQAQFHPLKLAASLAKELTIYENSRVTELIGNTATTEHGRIRAKKIVVTTHFPFLNKHGSYFLKLYQHRSYLLALENAGALDAMSLDGIPYIGQYSRNTPDLYVAAGFNKWGMTGSMVSAMLLTDLLHGKQNEYAEIFSPSRSILKPQLLLNCAETTANFLIPTTKRCPHLGCALKYNREERRWTIRQMVI